MGELFDLLSGSLGGSMVGAISAAIGKWYDGRMKLKIMEAERENTAIMNEHEFRMHTAETEASVKRLEYGALTTSMEMDKASYSVGTDSTLMRIVDFVRGMVRPIITATLLVYSLVLIMYLTKHYDVAFTNTQVYDLVNLMIQNLTTITGLALAWWFGSRDHSKLGAPK